MLTKEGIWKPEWREAIHGSHYHVTFEPVFDNIGDVDLSGVEWVVIGTETGRRKNKCSRNCPGHLSRFWRNRMHGKNNGKGSFDPGCRNEKYHD